MTDLRRIVVIWIVAAWVVVAGAAACTAPPSGAVTPEYHAETGQLIRLSLDENGDGRPEVVAAMRGPEVRVVEVDEDGDGQTDRWEYFERQRDTTTAGASGVGRPEPRLVRVERVVREGSVRRREAFEDGRLVWAREDRDGDGRDDRWETYADGGLAAVETDTDRSGRPDRVVRFNGDQMTSLALDEGPAEPPADGAGDR